MNALGTVTGLAAVFVPGAPQIPRRRSATKRLEGTTVNLTRTGVSSNARGFRAPSTLTILIDSNVFIALEDLGISPDIHSNDAARFFSLASEIGARVAISNGTRSDILSASDAKHRLRREQLKKYYVLQHIQPDPYLALTAGFPSQRSENDEADLEVLTGLASGAADWLLTQDSSLRNRARRAGYSEKVLSLQEILETLNSLLSKPSSIAAVATVKAYSINPNASVFNSVRMDYKDFDTWWRDKVASDHRDALLLGGQQNRKVSLF